MASYLTVDEFKLFAPLPPEWTTEIETLQAGWTLNRLTVESAWIDARLRKRYAAPFASPYPVAVQSWLARIVALQLLLRRGVTSQDEQFQEIKASHDSAREEIKEAADAAAGLFDLPLRADTTADGITKGGVRHYTEASPYVGLDREREIGRTEDGNGFGSEV